MLINRTARILFGLFVLLSLVVALPGDLIADPRQRGEDGVFLRQGHHIEWQRASYRNEDGYTLVAWSDTRTGDRDIYGQIINPDGSQRWESTGLPLAQVHEFRQEDPDVVAVDGGWIVFYFDFRLDSTGDSRALKVDIDGNILWDVWLDIHPAAVVEVSTRAVHDGQGGAICAWEDLRSGDEGDVYAQYVDSDGNVPYQTLNVTNMINRQYGITADGDGNGHMVLAWNDLRIATNADIFAAEISWEGSLHLEWTTQVCAATGDQGGAKICPDGEGGCYIAWADKRSGGAAPDDIYAQRLNGAGQPQWQADGIPISAAPNNQNQPRVAASINGGTQDGLIIVWEDYRQDNFTGEVYCQKVTPTGTMLWQADGFKVCGDATPGGGNPREGVRLTSDLSGGLVCAWEDLRDVELITDCDLYMARVLANGTHGCGECGVLVAAANRAQDAPLLRADEGNGVFVIYDDWQSGSQRIRYRHFEFDNCVEGETTEIVYGLDGNAVRPKAIPMSLGKVGIVWEDNRLVVGGKALFYQVMDTTGHILLPQNGDFLAPNNTGGNQYTQENHELCSDAAGGFFCVF